MRGKMPMSREMAEKTFNRKASPDAKLSPKEFLKKHPMMKAPSVDQIFHKSAGYASSASEAPTPFQMIRGGIKKTVGGVGKKVKQVGKFLDRQFVEPSRNVSRIRNSKLKEMERKAKSGEFNR